MKKHTEEVNQELEQLSPLLARIKPELPDAEPPARYFVDMQESVLRKARQEALARPKAGAGIMAWLQQLALWFRPLQQPRYAMAFATLALVIAAAVWILVPRHQADLMADANETLTQDEILAYIETNIEDFDTYLLLAALDDNSLMEVAPTGLDEKAREDLLDAILKELDASMLEELL